MSTLPPGFVPPPMDFILGPMVIGGALSLFFNGILTTQCYNYFIQYPRDPLWMKIMVAYFFITDIFHSGVEVAVIYIYMVSWFGRYDLIVAANWVFTMIPVLSVSISSVAQCFFAWRVARLTHQKWLGAIIAFLAIVQFLCGIGVTIAVAIVKQFAEFQKFESLVVTWLGCSAVCDIIITSSLCWYLNKSKSGIKSTDMLVTRIIRLTVQTGLLTTLWAVLDIIVFATEPNSLHLIFNFPLAKMYTNSLMSTLNARRAQFEASNATTLAGSQGAVSKLGGPSTMSVPTWERGFNQKSSERRGSKTINIFTTTTTEVHHDLGDSATPVRVRADSDYDEYELQHKTPPVGDAYAA